METKDRSAHLSLEQLEERILERLNQIKRIHKFAELIVQEYGRIVKLDVGSCYTHVIARLDNFWGFSFVLDTGQTMMGGNDLVVEFNSIVVLSVYYQSNLDECRVKIFDESGDWQSKLEYLINHKDEVIAKTEENEKDKQERRRLTEECLNKRAKLLETAKRLKL